MALHQSDWATGRKQAPVSREARGVVVERFTFTVSDDLAANDIIELAVLPAYHFPVDAVMVTDAMGTGVTFDVGIMSGDVGEDDGARTSGDELFDGTNVENAAVTRMSKADGFTLASANADRSIGLKVLGAGITAAGQEITLVLSYAQ